MYFQLLYCNRKCVEQVWTMILMQIWTQWPMYDVMLKWHVQDIKLDRYIYIHNVKLVWHVSDVRFDRVACVHCRVIYTMSDYTVTCTGYQIGWWHVYHIKLEWNVQDVKLVRVRYNVKLDSEKYTLLNSWESRWHAM